MARRGKKYVEKRGQRPIQELPLNEAIEKIKSLSYSKFTGSVELHIVLNLPKDTDTKSLRGSVSLPHSASDGTTKIAVFTTPDKEAEAKEAGADVYSMEQLMKDVKAGKIEFDVAIATPDVMPQIAALGKELGPRGLMPNPKTGTVTEDIALTVQEYKKGKLNFKCDDTGGMHFNVGKVDMDTKMISENIYAVVKAAAETINKLPKQAIKLMHIAPSMGPSVKVHFEEE